jgi:predicted dehydrogenase
MVAICDIDDNNLGIAAAQWGNAKKYNDYRKMLDEMGKSIDAVTVSTPDHTHAVVAAAAMKAGKHAFVQKPLTKSIYEARFLGDLARENKVATQMGNQGTANNALREAAALIKAGGVGTVKEVHVWTNLQVARLVGLRHRRSWRYGLPYAEHALHGSRSSRSDERAGQDLGPQQGNLPGLVGHRLRIPRAERPPRGGPEVVRRR